MARLDQDAEKIIRNVEQIRLARKITIVLKDGTERYGMVTEINGQDFQVIEVDLRQKLTISYHEGRKVRKDYGRKHSLSGKRVNPLGGRITGSALLGFFLITIPIIAGSCGQIPVAKGLRLIAYSIAS